jgi:CelD/BcsL family acetyltransferase involved in cellulose biosynthesis
MSIPQLSILVPTRPAEIESLRAEWNQLAERHRSPTHRIEWAQACMDTLWHPESGALRLYLVRREGRLTALAIMRMRREWGSAYFEDLGTREMQEPTDLLYETREDLAFLLDGMLGQGWPFVLCRLPGESLVPEVLAERLRGRGKMRLIEGRNYPYVPLEQFPEAELNSGRKSDLRRMRRRAEQRGPVRVELGCPPVHEVQGLLDLAVEIEAASWKLGTPHALKLNKKTLGFLRNLLPRAAESGTLRMAFMYIGDQPVAMQIAIACGGGYWLLKIGYDASLGSMAPGQLLMQDTIKASVEAGLRSYELWGHAAEWTRMWTSHEMASHCVEAYPLGLRSARRIAAMAVRKISARAKAAMSGGKAEAPT